MRMPWHQRPVRHPVAREATLAIQDLISPLLSERDLEGVLNTVEMVLVRALNVATSTSGGRRDPATGIARPANLNYKHAARTAEEAKRDEALVAKGQHLASPRESFEKHGEDRVPVDELPSVEGRPQPKKLWTPPSWA